MEHYIFIKVHGHIKYDDIIVYVHFSRPIRRFLPGYSERFLTIIL